MDKSERLIMVVKRENLFSEDFFEGFRPKDEIDYEARILKNFEYIKRGFAENDPNYKGVYYLAELSRRYGIDSAFYFMVNKDGDPYTNRGIDVASPWIAKVIKDLQERGFEIRLHPSYYTYDNPVNLASEKYKLDSFPFFP